MSFERELQTALEAAHAAGAAILEDYASLTAVANAPASISTATDRRSQELILQRLHADFPDDALCAEEATPTALTAASTGERLWVVDPIDGTRGFAMKNGEFSVMIGLIENGCLAVGVVLEPVQQRVTYATAGGGCWSRSGDAAPIRCRVSGESDPRQATLVQSHSKSGQPNRAVQAVSPARVVEMYSAGVKLALVARGEVDQYINTYPNFHDWDICAGHLLVAEAGGTVTTLAGKPIVYCLPGHAQRGGLLASNGKLHEEVVRLLKAVKLE
jgi:3'(2'), 5'-bisphosphate nucleotidase